MCSGIDPEDLRRVPVTKLAPSSWQWWLRGRIAEHVRLSNSNFQATLARKTPQHCPCRRLGPKRRFRKHSAEFLVLTLTHSNLAICLTERDLSRADGPSGKRPVSPVLQSGSV